LVKFSIWSNLKKFSTSPIKRLAVSPSWAIIL
jgi:hypothetical protein